MALVTAARLGDLPWVRRELANSGTDINARDETSDTALIAAAFAGHVSIVRRLLRVPGIDVNATDSGGCTALCAATIGNHQHAAAALLQAPGINVNVADNDGCTALMFAPFYVFDSSMTELLLEMPGIDVNAADNHGMTALATAALVNNIDSVKRLLDVPSICSDVMSVALGWAVDKDHVHVVQLIEAALRWRVRRHWVLACVHF